MSDVAGRGPDAAAPEEFRRLAQFLYDGGDVDQVFSAVVEQAPRLVAGCDHASLMSRRGTSLRTLASSDDVAATIDRFERELGEGPCLDAIVMDSAYHDASLLDGSRWPRLTARVLTQTPVRSMAGFRLRISEEQTGALNLFSDTDGGLTTESVNEGMVLASFLNVALMASHERRTADTLREGLHSNREIGKAIGLMMAFHKVSDEEAFRLLRKASQDMNVKLSEIARQVVDHHNPDRDEDA
jgi:transcriptional regulator with GAF, ATPase, and Fis domain